MTRQKALPWRKFGKLLCRALQAVEFDAELVEANARQVPYVAVYHPLMDSGGPGQKMLVATISLAEATAEITYAVPMYHDGVGRALTVAGQQWKNGKGR